MNDSATSGTGSKAGVLETCLTLEGGFPDESEVCGDAVRKGTGSLILEVGDGQAQEVGKEVFPQAVEGGFTGANEALHAEEADDCLQEKCADKEEDGAVDLLHDLCGRHGVPQAIDRATDEFFEEIREGQCESSGDEQGDERGYEDLLLKQQVGEDPADRGVGRFFFRQGHDGWETMIAGESMAGVRYGLVTFAKKTLVDRTV